MNLTPAKVKGFKVAELKEELTSRGLDASGVKSILQARLLEALDAPAATGETAAETAATEVPATEPAAVDEAAVVEAPAEDAEAPVDATPKTDAASAVEEETVVPADPLENLDERIADRKKRCEKFGQAFELTDEEKMLKRAQRFGIPVNTKGKIQNPTAKPTKASPSTGGGQRKRINVSEEDREKLAKRAKKFNMGVPSSKSPAASAVMDDEEKARREARAARFAGAPQ